MTGRGLRPQTQRGSGEIGGAVTGDVFQRGRAGLAVREQGSGEDDAVGLGALRRDGPQGLFQRWHGAGVGALGELAGRPFIGAMIGSGLSDALDEARDRVVFFKQLDARDALRSEGAVPLFLATVALAFDAVR